MQHLPSASDLVETPNKDLQVQKAYHRLMPIPDPGPGDRFISSPLGLAPSRVDNAWRRIHHLSYPYIHRNCLVPVADPCHPRMARAIRGWAGIRDWHGKTVPVADP